MRELLMLRHGMTEANERRLFSGSHDLPLTEKGRVVLAARRERYPASEVFFTSGMLRARQSLEVLYGEVPHTDIPGLAEYRFGRYEMRSHEDLYENEPDYRRWLEAEDLDLACPGGETRRAFSARVLRGWETLCAHEWEGLAVLVAHGGVLSVLVDAFVPGPEPAYPPENGCGWRVWIDENGGIMRREAFA